MPLKFNVESLFSKLWGGATGYLCGVKNNINPELKANMKICSTRIMGLNVNIYRK